MRDLTPSWDVAAEAPDRPAEPSAPPPAGPCTPESAAVPLAVAEVGSVRAFLLRDMPEPFALRVEHADGREAWLTFGRCRYAELRAREAIAFIDDEWDALVLGAEADRATAQQFAKYLDTKAKSPQRLLESRHTLGGVAPSTDSRRWSVGRVLARWGLTLAGVEYRSSQSEDEKHQSSASNASY